MGKFTCVGLVFLLLYFNCTSVYSFQLHIKIYKEPPEIDFKPSYTGVAKPVFSHDGKLLFFSLKYVEDNVGGLEDPGDVYLTKFENSNWTEAENIGKPINNDSPNGPISLLADNRSLYLLNKYGGGSSKGLSVSTMVKGKWRSPVNQQITNLEIRGQYSDFYVHPNGHLMLLAIENDKSIGSQDIFISHRSGKNSWTEPVNLGENINTIGEEYAPFFGADGKTIYFTHSFSADSAFDNKIKILMAKKTANGWQKGIPLPDSLFEKPSNSYLNLLTGSNFAMFIERDSVSDIGNPKTIFLDKSFLPAPVKELNGTILPQKNGKPKEIVIKAINLKTSEIEAWVYSHSEDGYFAMFLREGEDYQIEFGDGKDQKVLTLKVNDYKDFEKIKVDVQVN